MMRPLLTIGVCVTHAFAPAQIPFATAYRDTSLSHAYSHDYAQVARAPNGDVVMVVDLSETPNDRSIYALRTSAGGVLQWMQRIDAIGGEMWNVTDMALTPDGSIVITGYDALHGLFLRLDPTGVPVAAKWYSWTGTSMTTTLRVINDSAIVLFGNNRQSGVSRGWTAVVDGEGDLITLASSFQVDGFELAPIQALPVSSSQALVFGRSDVYGVPANVGVAAGVIDTSGVVQWASRVSSPGLTLRPVGCMVLADGSTRLVLRNDGGFTSQSTVVVALDPSGAVLWMKELHPKRGTWDLTSLSVLPMSDTSMAIVGYYDPVHSGALLIDTAANVLDHVSWNLTIISSEGYRDLNGELVLAAHTPASGSFDPALMRTYADLELCASATVSHTANAITLDVTPGFTTSTQSLTLVNILADFQPTVIAPALDEMCITVGMVDDPQALSGVSIHPNPVRDRVCVLGEAIREIRIIDAAGRVMVTRTCMGEDRIDLDLGALAPGLHHVIIRQDRGVSTINLIHQ